MAEDRCVCCGEIVPEGQQVCPSHILDSGERRTFESGAVRDIQSGKGRCDLLPLAIIADISSDSILKALSEFQSTGGIRHLHDAINLFCKSRYESDYSTMWLELSKHFEQGALKYEENNWQKGIPVRCYLDSATRHYLKFIRGDKDEPHDKAFVWNCVCCIWTIKNKPEMYEK